MTPLASTPPPVASKQAPPQGRSSPSGDAPETSFADILGQESSAAAGAGEPGAGRQHAHDQAPPDTDPAAPDPASLAWAATQVTQPAPAWPPAGLAGLLLSGGGAAVEAAGMQAAGERSAPLQPAASGGPLAAIATPAAALAQAPMPGPPAESLAPAAGLLAETAASPDSMAAGEGMEPPAVFQLPALAGSQPPLVREAAPLLAAPATLPTPDVRGQDFGDRFGAQLQWMAGQEIGHARIRVSPQELGPVEVLLNLDGDRITAEFISPQAETRQALEHGLPRLRDLLGEHGFQLAHADVGHGSSSPQDGRDGSTAPPGTGTGSTEAAATATDAAPVRTARGLLDAYA